MPLAGVEGTAVLAAIPVELATVGTRLPEDAGMKTDTELELELELATVAAAAELVLTAPPLLVLDARTTVL